MGPVKSIDDCCMAVGIAGQQCIKVQYCAMVRLTMITSLIPSSRSWRTVRRRSLLGNGGMVFELKTKNCG